jgi:hypothetical protein
MKRSRNLSIAGAALLALPGGGFGIAQALGADAEERVRGTEADRAERAAVQAAGGGRVVGVEREHEHGAAWEVELVRGDGEEVEVELSRGLEPVEVERGDAGADDDRDEDEGGDDD